MKNLTLDGYGPIVAIAYEDDGTIHDHCGTWETGQNFALAQGLRVVAVADDGHMDVPSAQRLYDAERERYIDCFGE